MGYNLALARSRLVVGDKSIPINNRSWACLAVAVHSGGSRPKPEGTFRMRLNLLSCVSANACFWESLRFWLPRSGRSRLAAEGRDRELTAWGN
jgi:hypothetical protein